MTVLFYVRYCMQECFRKFPFTVLYIISSLYVEIEELADHGITLPPNMQGLTEEQIIELKLKDEWADRCIPSGGYVLNKDDLGRRNGQGTFALSCLVKVLF